ncbi:hypothetical protein D1AOALGA4SA_7071 [Olavius algarvensis Delta 1 endosymbiont]|nr:hypothetical protein D1AOALGA4SA_7071 [Olavius algarvensis Delta 1 endosymbiont]
MRACRKQAAKVRIVVSSICYCKKENYYLKCLNSPYNLVLNKID